MPKKTSVKPNPGDVPDLLALQGKDPRFVYRYIRKDFQYRIPQMKARGWELCSAKDNPKLKGVYKSPEGYWESGDLIAAKMPVSVHSRLKARVEEKRKRQMGLLERELEEQGRKLGIEVDGTIETKIGEEPIEQKEE